MDKTFSRQFYRMIFCFLVYMASHVPAVSQIPTGTWRDHLPYKHGSRLAEYNQRIFCATSDGSLFSYGINDNSLKKHSKVNGLSDAGISTIACSPDQKTLFIGYSNGNIDLVRNDSVINLPDIKRKMIIGDKSIRNVYFRDNIAYLASGFGIVVCDLLRKEISESYYFGPGGSQIAVNDITSDGIRLFAATEGGVYSAEIEGTNLLDFNSWIKLSVLPDPETSYRFLAWYNNKLFTVYPNPMTRKNEIITVDSEEWEVWENTPGDTVLYLGEQNGHLVLSAGDGIWIYDPAGAKVRELLSYYARHALLDATANVWYAHPEEGLLRVWEDGSGVIMAPDGPAFLDVGDIEIENGQLWAGGGNFASKWTGYGAYTFTDEKWGAVNGNTVPAMKDFLNVFEIAMDPANPRHVLAGSWGYGIAEFLNGELTAIEDEKGGVLQPVVGFEGVPGFVRISGLTFDAAGNMYAAGTNSSKAVYRKKPGSGWETIELKSTAFGKNVNIGDILATTGGQVWLLLEDAGIVVFAESEDGSIREKFFTVNNQDGKGLGKLLALAEDTEGDIWVATSSGPVIYYEPEEIFESNVTGYQPIVPRNDGSGLASLLLSTERINDIEVDGANQKWLATEKSGVFLVSPDGKKEIHHFNEENSPLLSNSVQTISVNDKSGEVFFGTGYGIVAFRGVATDGTDDFGDVYVFPNPVREDYTGDITITGLVADVNVKITDISGNLVYETTAQGGQAVWNGKNFSGRRLHTGVYLVFCTNDDGTKTHVTKLLFIH
ncbi:MAG: T9SS type A sorting domain-containing protein [Bacteroidales bacterium]|nr:T9SS type A sorting domain-containing protein [Bacteroidales bacterium]